MKKERCLVLGGGGFIGKHLCQALLNAGYLVRIFSKSSTPLKLNADIEWFQGEFTNIRHLENALDKCDWVFHLISATIPQTSNKNPIYDLESNVVTTLHLLDLISNRKQVQKIIFLSSGGTVYGIPKSIPILEEHPTNPLSAYGISKLTIEKYLALYSNMQNVNYTVLRLANPYGEYQKVHTSQGAISVFIYKVLHNETIEIWGNGSVTRDYIYISDVVSAIIKSMTYDGQNNVFNIGSGVGTSLIELITIIESVSKIPVKCRFLDGRKFDVPINVLDISRAQKDFNWSPQVALQEGLGRMYTYLKNLE
jgi:UDP-glucose 4-epimerase